MKNLPLILPLLLAACGSGGDQGKRICPQAAIVRDLAQVADFAREEIADQRSLVAAGKIGRVESRCNFDKNTIEVEIEAQMLARRGPQLGGDRVEFPYFAAILNDKDQPVAKQNMSARFRFDSDGRAEITEKLRVAIPEPASASGAYWRVLLGFQLSPEQLAFNRNEKGEPKPVAAPVARARAP